MVTFRWRRIREKSRFRSLGRTSVQTPLLIIQKDISYRTALRRMIRRQCVIERRRGHQDRVSRTATANSIMLLMRWRNEVRLESEFLHVKEPQTLYTLLFGELTLSIGVWWTGLLFLGNDSNLSLFFT